MIDFVRWLNQAVSGVEGPFCHSQARSSSESHAIGSGHILADIMVIATERPTERQVAQPTKLPDKRTMQATVVGRLHLPDVALPTEIPTEHPVEQAADAITTDITRQPEPVSDDAEPTARGQSCFFDLPPEIRLMIYKEALPTHHKTIPALLLCSLQICQEASSLCTRVLSVEFFGGSQCQYPDNATQTQRFQTVADRIQKASATGIRIRLLIEVRCGGGHLWGRTLQPVLGIIHSTPTLEIDVLPHRTACMACSDFNPSTQQKATRLLKDLLDRVIDDRDHGFIRAAAYLAPH